MKRLDFRDPQTMKLQYSIDVPRCAGINHADFSIDGAFAIFTCEFSGTVAKIDLVKRKVLGYVQVIQPGRPTHSVVVLYDEALMSTGRTATPWRLVSLTRTSTG